MKKYNETVEKTEIFNSTVSFFIVFLNKIIAIIKNKQIFIMFITNTQYISIR